MLIFYGLQYPLLFTNHDEMYNILWTLTFFANPVLAGYLYYWILAWKDLNICQP